MVRRSQRLPDSFSDEEEEVNDQEVDYESDESESQGLVEEDDEDDSDYGEDYEDYEAFEDNQPIGNTNINQHIITY